MVEAKWRALMAAARWNGHADQNTTGVARASATQPQCGNCAAGTMEMMNSGTVKIAPTTRRFFRSLRAGSAAWFMPGIVCGSLAAGESEVGSAAAWACAAGAAGAEAYWSTLRLAW